MPNWKRRDNLEIDGGRAITIEVWERFGENSLADAQTWVVSKANPKHREALPVPKPSEDVPFDFDRFAISPDEYAILASRKIEHGMNEMHVLHRVGDLRYKLAENQSLNDRIGKQYGLPRELGARGEYEFGELILFQRWLPDGRHALIAYQYTTTAAHQSETLYYLVTLDTHTGKLTNYHRVHEKDVVMPN